MRHQIRRILVVLGLFSASTAHSASVDQIIVNIKSNYQIVDQNVKQGMLDVKQRSFRYCAGAIDQRRSLWMDEKGFPRKYVEQGGSDDSVATISYYLSNKGKIQFVIVELGRVSGSQESLRVYYDDSGRVVKFIDTPSMSISSLWSFIHLDVRQAFLASYSCDR